MLQLLQGLGLVRRGVSEDPGTWRDIWEGGDALFLQLGDVVDRGDEGQRMWKFLWALQDEQPASVVLFVGNHEAMLLTRQYKTAGEAAPSLADKCTYTMDPAWCQDDFYSMRTHTCVDPPGGAVHVDTCFDRAWSAGGFMGRQVQERMTKGQMKMAHVVAGTVFVHAGVTLGALGKLADDGALSNQYIEAINARTLQAILENRHGDFVLTSAGAGHHIPSQDGPAWTRNFKNHGNCKEVYKVLKALGAKRMVKGHDPQYGVLDRGEAQAHCSGKLLLTDTLMSEGYTGRRRTSERNLMAFETSTGNDDGRFVYPLRQKHRCSSRVGAPSSPVSAPSRKRSSQLNVFVF